MAQPTVLPGTKLLVLVGDGASPEVFAAPCGLTTQSFGLTAATNTTVLPDCADPELPAWEAKDISSLAAQITGSGVMAVESFDTWKDWFMSAAAKNAQVKLDNAALGHFSGSWILSSFKLTGQRGNKVTIDVTMDNNGAVIWTDAT
jgi:hypothetical protein